MRKIIVLTVFLFSSVGFTASDPTVKYRDADWRRAELKKQAVSSFKASSNHCKTFADIADIAAKNVKTGGGNVGDFMEDLRLVIIGSDTFLRRKGKRGKYYIGITTNDSGFKPELKDGSPQVEHAYAGIYFAKGAGMVQGAVGFWGSVVEFIQDASKGKVTAADKLLYGFASDIGSRLANNNFTQIKTPITRTLCE